jgi:hypothetical protein
MLSHFHSHGLSSKTPLPTSKPDRINALKDLKKLLGPEESGCAGKDMLLQQEQMQWRFRKASKNLRCHYILALGQIAYSELFGVNSSLILSS